MTLPVRREQSNDPSRSSFGWDPLLELSRVNQRISELLESSWLPLSNGAFIPPADIEETDDAYLVEVELPGVKREDVEVELVGRRLTVHGERKERERVGILRRRTRRVGEFHYEVTLPGELAEGDIEASFADGVLTVRAPKAESVKPRKIKVS